MSAARDMATALAAPEDQPAAAFRGLEALARAAVGAQLFTVMLRDPARGVARRAYSNMPDAYPVSGEKPWGDDRWSATVARGEAFVANDVAGFADVFADHALIASLGFESVLNLPIILAGELRGTLNCLAGPGHFTPERIAAAEALRVPGAAAILLADALARG